MSEVGKGCAEIKAGQKRAKKKEKKGSTAGEQRADQAERTQAGEQRAASAHPTSTHVRMRMRMPAVFFLILVLWFGSPSALRFRVVASRSARNGDVRPNEHGAEAEGEGEAAGAGDLAEEEEEDVDVCTVAVA